MALKNVWAIALLVAAGSQIASCGGSGGDAHGKAEEPHPVTIEKLADSGLSRLTLSERAAGRLGIQTARVQEIKVAAGEGGSPATSAVPYGALLYDASGQTWVYTSPKPLVYVRASIDVERIVGEHVLLKQGPDVGTEVVTVGAAELFGAEFEIGH